MKGDDERRIRRPTRNAPRYRAITRDRLRLAGSAFLLVVLATGGAAFLAFAGFAEFAAHGTDLEPYAFSPSSPSERSSGFGPLS